MASAPDPVMSSSVLTWALRLLAAAVALRLAVALLASIAPLLVGITSSAALLYVIYLVHKIRRSRW